MRTKLEKINRLAAVLETCGGNLDVKKVCNELDISEMTLRRYLKEYEKSGYRFQWNKGRIQVQDRGKAVKPAMFSKGGYQSFRILLRICQKGSCSRGDLKNKFCEENIYSVDESMTIRNLDHHLKKLMEMGYVRREGIGENVTYHMCEEAITFSAMPIDKALRVIDLLIAHQNTVPFADVTTRIMDKVEGMMINTLRTDKVQLENARMLYKIHPDCVLSTDVKRLEKLAFALEEQCRQGVVLEIQTKAKGSHLVHPVLVEYNSNSDEWYLVYSRVESPEALALMKLARIRRWSAVQVEGLSQSVYETIREQACELIENSFSVCLEELSKVKILFKETPSAKRLLDRSIFRDQVFKTDDLGIILETEIQGLNEFHAWLRRFGGDAVVLQPEELREMHIRDAARAARNYWKEAEMDEGSLLVGNP